MIDLSLLDLRFQGEPGVIASFIFDDGADLGIVETGPTTTLPALLEGLADHGGVDRLGTVVVTHVHLDHMGAVGSLLSMAPNARVYVHEVGARHLIDPSRLLRSAARIYGDQMERLWGEVLPVAPERVISVSDGDVITVGGTELEVVSTPGHASHHIALYHSAHKALFTGDMAGVRLQGMAHVRPPTPPPDTDVELWKASAARVLGLHPDVLYLTHFGPFFEPGEHFHRLLERLDQWTDLVRSGLDSGQSREQIIDELRQEADGDLVGDGRAAQHTRQLELASPYGMSVDGLIRYVEKFDAQDRASA